MDYEITDIKPYKGHSVQKVQKVDEIDGTRYGKPFYVVGDTDGELIGEEYRSVADAHRFIDSIN